MIKQTPYTIQIEDLFLSISYLRFELLGFIPDITTFKDDMMPLINLKSSWVTPGMENIMEIRTEMVISGTLTTDARLRATLNCTVEKNGRLEIGRVGVILAKYLFDLADDYIEDNNLVDKNGMPFKMPDFLYSASHFENDRMG